MVGVLSILTTACAQGPSDAEIQRRIDLAVAEAIQSQTTEAPPRSEVEPPTTVQPLPATTAPPSCAAYRAALNASDASDYGSVFNARAQKALMDALDEFRGVELAPGWIGEYAHYSAVVASHSDAWQILSAARPPEMIQDLHVELMSALLAKGEAAWDVWEMAYSALPWLSPAALGKQERHIPEIPSSREWDDGIAKLDETSDTYGRLQGLIFGTCSS